MDMEMRAPTATIFESLKGCWHLKRSLSSVLPGFPSGVFEGTAYFIPRKPTVHSAVGELLYTEQGELKTEKGLILKANRKYIYRYNADEEKISAWFVKEDTKLIQGNEEVDYLFHDLELARDGAGWVGRGDHLCDKDMYWAFYDFRTAKDPENCKALDVFGLRYKVVGPSKDYSSDTAYQRVFSDDLTES